MEKSQRSKLWQDCTADEFSKCFEQFRLECHPYPDFENMPEKYLYWQEA